MKGTQIIRDEYQSREHAEAKERRNQEPTAQHRAAKIPTEHEFNHFGIIFTLREAAGSRSDVQLPLTSPELWNQYGHVDAQLRTLVRTWHLKGRKTASTSS
jgi:hypothetical protein